MVSWDAQTCLFFLSFPVQLLAYYMDPGCSENQELKCRALCQSITRNSNQEEKTGCSKRSSPLTRNVYLNREQTGQFVFPTSFSTSQWFILLIHTDPEVSPYSLRSKGKMKKGHLLLHWRIGFILGQKVTPKQLFSRENADQKATWEALGGPEVQLRSQNVHLVWHLGRNSLFRAHTHPSWITFSKVGLPHPCEHHCTTHPKLKKKQTKHCWPPL